MALARGHELSRREAPSAPAPAPPDAGVEPQDGGQVARLLEGRPVDVNRASAEGCSSCRASVRPWPRASWRSASGRAVPLGRGAGPRARDRPSDRRAPRPLATAGPPPDAGP
ncbi:MAG: hypothetical protein M5U28_08495 [Sandaracinaceae bacterium]|nr:hypothetical protein [Sandaracinaceae bacterium]